MGHSSSYQLAQAGPYDDDDDDDDERMYASVFTGEEAGDDVQRKRRQRSGGAKPSWCRPSPQEHYGHHKPWK